MEKCVKHIGNCKRCGTLIVEKQTKIITLKEAKNSLEKSLILDYIKDLELKEIVEFFKGFGE
jgi:hypothetical protein